MVSVNINLAKFILHIALRKNQINNLLHYFLFNYNDSTPQEKCDLDK